MRDHLLHFPPFVLNLTSARLQKGRREIPLQPKEFSLLCYLARNPGRLISSKELLSAVWPGVIVTPGVLKVRIRRVRQALGDNPDKSRFIETVHGQGYRFVAAVTTQPVRSSKFKVSSSSPLPVSDVSEQETPSAQPGAWNLKRGTLLVGRDVELTLLHQRFEKAASGERQIIFVTGEPEIGKTALLATFLSSLGQQDKTRIAPRSPMPDAWIARGQCIEHYGAGEAYMPVLEALGRLCRGPEGKELIGLLRQHAPTWLAQMPSLLSTADLHTLQP